MITVKAELLTLAHKPDEVESMRMATFNSIARDNKNRLDKLLNKLVCDTHPHANQTVIVKAKLDGIEFIKKDFCCKKFENQIELTVIE